MLWGKHFGVRPTYIQKKKMFGYAQIILSIFLNMYKQDTAYQLIILPTIHNFTAYKIKI